MKISKARCRAFLLAAPIILLTPYLSSAADPEPGSVQAPTVQVIGTTPLPGLGVPKDSVPGNVQTANDEELAKRPISLPSFIDRTLESVNINEAQGNPYQPDVNYRGFTASPLIGTPQGISVFQDGVRINEPFGDSINWDLLPKSAISNMTLIPGSNPVFGLNTLGGALAIETKNGFDFPGFSAQAYGGSWGRRAVESEFGGHGDRLGYFVTGNYLDEVGWRDDTYSRLRQGFGKLSYRDSGTDIDLSFTGANNTLNGAQTIPQSFYLQNREQAYTFPDTTGNQLAFVNLGAKHSLNPDDVLSGNTYYRSLRQRSFSTNINDDFDPTSPVAPGNTEGSNVQDNTTTQGYGAGLQFSHLGKLAGFDNRFTIGGSADLGQSYFEENQQEANFAPDRSNIPVGNFTTNTNVRTNNYYYGLYATDTFSVTKRLDLTLAGRYNRAEVKIKDLTGTTPALNSTTTTDRFNPAAGLTFKANDALTAYAAYNEGMRVATPVELTCSDPAAPCSLPNEFLADPPLKPVIARTFETGLRGRINGNLRWRATAYRTTLQDDILFVSASAGSPNTGFFQNIGTTRHQGFELALDGRNGALTWFANYSFIDARYRTGFTESSPSNTSADANGNIQVQPGNQIPGIPRNIFKARAEYEFKPKWSIGGSMYAATSQFARGDENNLDVNGKVQGYTIFNLDARWAFARGWELFAEVDNLFNTHYETLGVLGTNFFNGPGHTFDATNTLNELFLSPGAPLAAWIGVRYSFGAGAQ